jgi:phenylalanyl-tRNA synthetase alpha subunit
MKLVELVQLVIALFGSLIGIVTVAYRVTKIESQIYSAIDDSTDKIANRLNIIERDLAVQEAWSKERREIIDYHIHSLNEKIEHKSNRLHGYIKDLQTFLEKHGFVKVDS